MDKPLIAEVHIIVESNNWPKAFNNIIKILKKCDKEDYALTPLYATYDLEDTEVRICLQFEDPAKLEKFIVEKIRKINGVYATRVRLTLNGEIFPKGIEALTTMDETLYSCHIFINTIAGKDEQVWESLRQLKGNNHVFPVWIFRDFYEYAGDITLRLIGREIKSIRNYIEKFISNIYGIKTWKLKVMYNAVQILDRDKLLKMAKNWFCNKNQKEK